MDKHNKHNEHNEHDEYDEFKLITDTDKHIFFCHINGSLDDAIKHKKEKQLEIDKKTYADMVYHCAQGGWKISKSRLSSIKYIKYVFAIYHSKVVGIYKVAEDSWTHRNDLYKKYEYTETASNNNKRLFPTDHSIRKLEFEYSMALKDCKSERKIEHYLKLYKDNTKLSLEELENKVLGNRKFKNWQDRYFFSSKRDVKDISEDISAFYQKIILFPIAKSKNIKGKYRTIHQNEHYNFDTNGIIKRKYK